MDKEPFVIERTFNAPIEKVWQAITDKKKMKQWYFDIAEFEPVVGFEFQFEGGDNEKTFLHLCKIVEVVPNKKLKHSWRYEGYTGNSFVTWELFEEGKNKTRVKLTHEGLETFPAIEYPSFAKKNFVAGWTEIVGTLLQEFVQTETLKLSVEINASSSKVWQVLVNPTLTQQWANAFSEGAKVETDWKTGSPVVWKDSEGNIGAQGVVVANEPNRLLKVAFYDDENIATPGQIGAYTETYTITEEKDRSLLSIEAGLLSVKDSKTHTPHWEKGIAIMKALAEK